MNIRACLFWILYHIYFLGIYWSISMDRRQLIFSDSTSKFCEIHVNMEGNGGKQSKYPNKVVKLVTMASMGMLHLEL